MELADKNKHDINTGHIYVNLQREYRVEKSKYNREFVEELENNILFLLREHREIILYTPEKADQFEGLYERYTRNRESKNPFTEFYLDEHRFMANYGHSFIVSPDEIDFNYFFALQLSITDILDLFDFLDYQRIKTFDGDWSKFKLFIELLQIKYQYLILNDNRIKEVVNKYLQEKVPIADINQTDKQPPITWLGTQAELAELFIELQQKGWISETKADVIKNHFSKSDSIDQYLKPYQDPKTYKNQYSKVYTPRYKAKFSKIEKQPKTK